MSILAAQSPETPNLEFENISSNKCSFCFTVQIIESDQILEVPTVAVEKQKNCKKCKEIRKGKGDKTELHEHIENAEWLVEVVKRMIDQIDLEYFEPVFWEYISQTKTQKDF